MIKVLSIDGGGIRGLIPALVLAEIEKQSQQRISSLFDLIAGTSTGGILTLGLSLKDEHGEPKYTANDIADLYNQKGSIIFNRSTWKVLTSLNGITDEKYDAKGLEDTLFEYFGDSVLADGLNKTMLSSYDIERRCPFFFKSWIPEHQQVPMRNATRATSAAPTFFSPASVNVNGHQHSLIDGGIYLNNPSVSAYAEATRLFPNETEFLVVSVGTGEQTRVIDINKAKDWGKAEWIHPLISCMFDGVSDAAGYQLRQLLGGNFVRFQTVLRTASDDIDDASPENMQKLHIEADKLLDRYKDTIAQLIQRLTQ